MKKLTGWKSALRLLFQALALSFIQLPGAFAQQEPAVKLKIDTELVNLNVVVTDKSGQRVRGLVKDDFEIFEDGIKQEISHFVAEERPLKLALVFDISLSMEEILPAVKRTAIRFVESLSADDSLSVVSFASEARLHSDWAGKEKTIEAIRVLSAEPHIQPVPPAPGRNGYNVGDFNTFLYEGFQYVFDMLRNNRDRVAVIMFSDGVDTGGGRTISKNKKREEEIGQETKRQAEESWALVYPVRFKTKQVIGYFPEPAPRRFPSIGIKIGGPPKIPRIDLFSEITAASGGRVFEFTGVDDLAHAVQEVLADLRSQYGIAYTPPEAESRKGFHRIKVLVKKPGLVARTRNGYLVTK
ncbi:MAG TPA: VWA domain-containing protein [Blastocatellia bacterium]